MHRTYELYLRHPDGHVTFEALTHLGSHLELMSHVRGLLAERGAAGVEVRMGGDHLFNLEAPDALGRGAAFTDQDQRRG